MKVVVFLNSYEHFNPKAKAKYHSSSTSFIASEIYTALISDEDIALYYFDVRKVQDWRSIKADYLVTIIDNFQLAVWYFRPTTTVLIAVNKHPLTRLKLLGTAFKHRIPQKALSGSDGIYEAFLPMRFVDYIILIGNTYTLESYNRYFKEINILESYYDSANFGSQLLQEAKFEMPERNSILISMSSIGFRKNYLIIHQLMKQVENQNYHFYLLGAPASSYWDNLIQKDKAKQNFTYLGFIEGLNKDSISLMNILPRIKIALFPSLEEGLPGSMLDLINFGIICVHNRKNSGLDNSLEILESDFRSINETQSKIDYLMQLDNDSYSAVQKIQREELKEMFSTKLTFSQAIKKILEIKDVDNRNTKVNYRNIITDLIIVPFICYPIVLLKRINRNSIIVLKNKWALKKRL